MPYVAYEVLLDAVAALHDVLPFVRAHSADLADQLRRAGENAMLNLAEARRRAGRDRINRYRYFAGEAAECVAGLDVAIVRRYHDRAALAAVRAAFDRCLGMTWKEWKPR